jgi:hypothetical protein
MQLELFQWPIEKDDEKRFEEILDKYERLRKSQHARISGLQKEIKELKSDLEFLKSHICKGNFLL